MARSIMLAVLLAAVPATSRAQSAVRVEPAHLNGPRVLAPQTAQAVLRDYLESWKAMSAALEQNRPGLLDADFVGTAKDKLAATVREQEAAGIHTRYQDQAHDLQIVFYSPEGLSVELTDNVDYNMEVFDHSNSVATRQVHARYIVVMTPAEVRWRVRVLQAQGQ